jgi:hypothetical protein
LEVKSDWNWSTKLGIDGSEDGSERRVRSNEDDDEERERGVLRHASYTRFDSQYLGDFYSDSGKPPLVVVAVVAAVSRL